MAIFSLLAAFAPLAITIMLLILSELSRRLGSVLRIGNLHRLYYVAAFLTGISTVIRLLSIGFASADFQTENGDTFFSLSYTLTLATGVLLGLAITWRYWGWLVYASDGKTLL